MDFNISFHDLVLKLFLLVRLTINIVGNPIIPPESPCLTSVLIWNIIYLGFVHSLSKNGKMKKKWKSARWGRDVMFHFFFNKKWVQTSILYCNMFQSKKSMHHRCHDWFQVCYVLVKGDIYFYTKSMKELFLPMQFVSLSIKSWLWATIIKTSLKFHPWE